MVASYATAGDDAATDRGETNDAHGEFGPPMLEVGPPAPDFEPPVSDLGPPAADSRPPTADTEPPPMDLPPSDVSMPDASTAPDGTPPCTTEQECDDGDACTNDLCVVGSCEHSAKYCGTGLLCSPSTGTCVGAPISSFQDDFADGLIGSEWIAKQTGACTAKEASGAVSFQLNGGGVSRCTLTTTARYDMTNSAASIDIPVIYSYYPPIWAFLQLDAGPGDRVEFGFQNGSLISRIFLGGQLKFSQNSSYPNATGFWRLREQGGQIYFEISSGTPSWQTISQTSSLFPLTAVTVTFGVETFGVMPGAVGIGVRAYNIAP